MKTVKALSTEVESAQNYKEIENNEPKKDTVVKWYREEAVNPVTLDNGLFIGLHSIIHRTKQINPILFNIQKSVDKLEYIQLGHKSNQK